MAVKREIETIIAGLGPAGLSSALALLIRGHNITIIDKRSQYELQQKVVIPRELIAEFYQLGINKHFLNKLSSKLGLTSLRKFQQFQMEVLIKIIQDKKVNYQGVSIPIVGSIRALQGEDKEIIQACGENQTVTLKDGQKIGFDYLVDATGNKHVVTSMIEKASNGKYRIAHSKDIIQPTHRANAIVSFNAKCLARIVGPLNAKNNYDLKHFSAHGWMENHAPLFYLRSKINKDNIYLLIEIPETLLGAKPDKIIDYAMPILNKECLLKRVPFDLSPQDISLFATFNLDHSIADTPYMMLGQNGAAIVVGDARMPANFHYGNGVEKAIKDGMHLQMVFDAHNNFNPAPLIKRAKQLRNEVENYSSKHQQILEFMAFNHAGLLSKAFILFKGIFRKDSIPLLLKSMLCVLLYPISLKLAFIAGVTSFALMSYHHFFAKLTYRLPRLETNFYKEVHLLGETAQESWKGYFTSFTHKKTYTNYFSFVEGRYAAQERQRLEF